MKYLGTRTANTDDVAVQNDIKTATTTSAGLLSASDKGKLDRLDEQYRGFDIPQAYGEVTGNPAPQWMHLLDFTFHYSAESLIIDVYWGDGYNGDAYQNEWWKIFLKKGWQSTASATKTVGATVMVFGTRKDSYCQAKVLCDTATTGQVWLMCSSLYMNGKYRCILNSRSIVVTEAIAFQKDAPTPEGYVEQDCVVQLMANTTDTVAAAKKWATARTLSLTGAVTGSVSFDGSGNASLATTVNHTHNYAGSSSAGGAATSALKLANARTVTLGTLDKYTFSFDGSSNVTATADDYSGRIYRTAYSYAYIRFASIENITTNWKYYSMLLSVRVDNGSGQGILRIAFCTYDLSTTSSRYKAFVEWIVRPNRFPVDMIQVGYEEDRADFYVYTNKSGAPINIKVLSSSYSGNAQRTFTLYKNNDASTQYATLDEAAAVYNGGAYTNTKIGSDTGITQYANQWSNSRTFYISDSTGANTGAGVSVNGTSNVTLKLPATIAANASTATKLATARTVSGGVLDTWSFTFDGSGNVNATNDGYWCRADSEAAANYPYHRIASVETNVQETADYSIIFLINQRYAGGYFGIFKVDLRSNNTAVSEVRSTWLVRDNRIRSNCIQFGLINTPGATHLDVFYWNDNAAYLRTTFRVLNSTKSNVIGRYFTLYNSNEANDTTATDKLTSAECYASIAEAGQEINGQAYSVDPISISSDGRVEYASQLATSRSLQVNLASTSAVSFNGTANVSIGVTGTLPVANGGTGLATLTSGYALIGNGTSAVSLRAISNNTSVGVCGVNSNLVTVNHLAYWNGAYGGTNNQSSNLTYCKTGTIIGSNGGTMSGALTVNALLTATTLSVSGQASVGSLKIGDATITWDSTSNALKVDKNFYATGTVASGV